jgi:CheY-like chemotaxis protein
MDTLSVPSPLNILLAEDNLVNQKVALRVLKHLGYVGDVVGNGVEVIQAIANKSYDLILMDIQMPEMDGLTAIKLIRANPETANIPIIALTALAMNDDREKCLAAGANEYMSKPFRLRTLANTIQDYCDRLNNHEET